MNLNFLTKKRKALWFKFVQNILFFWKSPKSVWQCFHFFLLQSVWKLSNKFCRNFFIFEKKMFSNQNLCKYDSAKDIRRWGKWANTMHGGSRLQATRTKRSWNQPLSCKGAAVTDRWSLCKSLQNSKLTFLIHHNPTFHLRVKNQKKYFFFFLNFLRWTKILSRFFFVSTISVF